MLAVWGLSATASVGGALYMLYPNLAGQFGSALTVGKKTDFPAALPADFKQDQAGVFYRQEAKTYLVHLAKGTHFLLNGSSLQISLTQSRLSKTKMALTGLRSTSVAFTLAARMRTVPTALASNVPAMVLTIMSMVSIWTDRLRGARIVLLSPSMGKT